MGIASSIWDRLIGPGKGRFVSRGIISLVVSACAAVLTFPLLFVAFIAIYSICGDQSSTQCGPQPWTAYIPALFVGVPIVILALIAVVWLIRAVILFIYAASTALTSRRQVPVVAVEGVSRQARPRPYPAGVRMGRVLVAGVCVVLAGG